MGSDNIFPIQIIHITVKKGNVTACTPNTNTECMRVKVMRDVTHNGIRAILKSTLNSHIIAIPLLKVVV